MRLSFLAPLAALFAVACAPAPVRVITPISSVEIGQSMVSDVEVTLSPLATEAMAKFEEKAAQKRADAKLAPVSADDTLAARPAQSEYDTLPFKQMFELVVQDVTRDWGLAGGRPLKLAVEIDTLKTANAGMAMVAGSSDQLAGTVSVMDATSNEKLGEFYVDVINSHSGWMGLLMRGGGIREKLSEEFALHISRQLTGRKSKGASNASTR